MHAERQRARGEERAALTSSRGAGNTAAKSRVPITSCGPRKMSQSVAPLRPPSASVGAGTHLRPAASVLHHVCGVHTRGAEGDVPCGGRHLAHAVRRHLEPCRSAVCSAVTRVLALLRLRLSLSLRLRLSTPPAALLALPHHRRRRRDGTDSQQRAQPFHEGTSYERNVVPRLGITRRKPAPA